MERVIYRVVTKDPQGLIETRDFESLEQLCALYHQVGNDTSSTVKELRGLPLFRGLIGPMQEGQIIRYETPEVFEQLTQDWYAAVPVSKGRGMAI
ncbi:MAG: hypothetical protein IJD43_05820 [Thermoguttaceae bacterium]|nr:hypothetical protein [Planctomycetaceae bacterium]MBQ4142978.1 hypothetical protein [Thermoguttaceae bacterium]